MEHMVREGPNSPSPPEIPGGNTTITILSVSPTQDDHDALERLLHGLKWKIHTTLTLASAVTLLQKIRIPLVVCERNLLPGTWKDMLDYLLTVLPQPPYLIVTSRLADDHLWAEALNIGAYDVLAKPFHGTEVNRILSLAWRHWHDRGDQTTAIIARAASAA
jgi:DNA-binding NtrC family response regulator